MKNLANYFGYKLKIAFGGGVGFKLGTQSTSVLEVSFKSRKDLAEWIDQLTDDMFAVRLQIFSDAEPHKSTYGIVTGTADELYKFILAAGKSQDTAGRLAGGYLALVGGARTLIEAALNTTTDEYFANQVTLQTGGHTTHSSVCEVTISRLNSDECVEHFTVLLDKAYDLLRRGIVGADEEGLYLAFSSFLKEESEELSNEFEKITDSIVSNIEGLERGRTAMRIWYYGALKAAARHILPYSQVADNPISKYFGPMTPEGVPIGV